MAKKNWLVIIAGGKGKRLFLYSNPYRQKQFCRLNNEDTFLQDTVKRYLQFNVDPRQVVIIVTNDIQRDQAVAQTVERFGVQPENIVEIEANHGYAGAMIVATNHIYGSDPDAIVISTPADQAVDTDDNFKEVINAAIENVSRDDKHVVFIGKEFNDQNKIKEFGVFTYTKTPQKVVAIDEFYEKPKGDTLKTVMSKSFACNTGISVWASNVFRPCLELEKREVATDELINELRSRLTIDLVVGKFPWDDCGTFRALYDVNRYKTGDNTVVLNNTEGVVYEDCPGSLLINDPALEMDIYGAEDVSVTSCRMEGHNYLQIAKHDHNDGVVQAAETFENDPKTFHAGLTIGGQNNIFMPLEKHKGKFHCNFIGVSGYLVTTYDRKSGHVGFRVVRTTHEH